MRTAVNVMYSMKCNILQYIPLLCPPMVVPATGNVSSVSRVRMARSNLLRNGDTGPQKVSKVLQHVASISLHR